ncbi:MAG: hypothetical protein ACOC22_00080 [bacterium]
MAKYIKENPRLKVQFFNSDNDELLFEIHDRTHMNIGEILTTYYVSKLINSELKGRVLPENLLVLVVSEYKKSE